ncbi:5158_t:CDS:1, partial [Acaulospora colombiana]
RIKQRLLRNEGLRQDNNLNVKTRQKGKKNEMYAIQSRLAIHETQDHLPAPDGGNDKCSISASWTRYAIEWLFAFLCSRSSSLSRSCSTSRGCLLEGKELLRSEGLVVDLGRSLDQILQVCPEEEITEVHELAMTLILDIHNTPSVLATADGLSVNDHIALRANDGEGDHGADDIVVLQFLLIKLVRIKGIEADVVVY